VKVPIQLRKHAKAVADAIAQHAVAFKQGFGAQPARVIGQVQEVLQAWVSSISRSSKAVRQRWSNFSCSTGRVFHSQSDCNGQI
jgi:hypothetical protein